MLGIFKRKKNKLDDLDLLSFVSHELKSPLSTIKLSVDILKKTISREEEKIIKTMDQEVNWMIQFISDTLDMKRTDDRVGKSYFKLMWNKWIKDLQKNIEEKVNLHNRKLKIHFSEKEIEVYMDPLYMKQALLNLIMNAAEYSFENSCIELSWTQMEKGDLSVQVMDEGPGVKQEDKDKIFEPFYKGREKTNSTVRGSGLGLTIVKKIVQAHGGEVYTRNRPDNKGALFIFTLPQTHAIFE